MTAARREWFDDPERDALSGDLGDLGEECMLIVRQLVLLAHLSAQHACEVPGVIAGEFCAIALNPVYEKSAAGQKIRMAYWKSR